MEACDREKYTGMSDAELKAEMESLAEQFEAYKAVLAEAYSEMGSLSDGFNEIKAILEERNGQKVHNQQG